MEKNNYTPPQSSLEDRQDLEYSNKVRLFELAVTNQALIRLYPMVLFSYIFPPLLLILNVIAIFFVFRVARRLYGILMAAVISPFAFLPLIGLLVIFLVMRKANTVIEEHGFVITMDKNSLEPLKDLLAKDSG